MKNTLKVLATVLALSVGSVGYVATADAAMVRMDNHDNKMMMKGHHGRCMTYTRHGRCMTKRDYMMMKRHMMMKHHMMHMMKKY